MGRILKILAIALIAVTGLNAQSKHQRLECKPCEILKQGCEVCDGSNGELFDGLFLYEKGSRTPIPLYKPYRVKYKGGNIAIIDNTGTEYNFNVRGQFGNTQNALKFIKECVLSSTEAVDTDTWVSSEVFINQYGLDSLVIYNPDGSVQSEFNDTDTQNEYDLDVSQFYEKGDSLCVDFVFDGVTQSRCFEDIDTTCGNYSITNAISFTVPNSPLNFDCTQTTTTYSNACGSFEVVTKDCLYQDVDTTTFLVQDSILVYYEDGVEVDRDTIRFPLYDCQLVLPSDYEIETDTCDYKVHFFANGFCELDSTITAKAKDSINLVTNNYVDGEYWVDVDSLYFNGEWIVTLDSLDVCDLIDSLNCLPPIANNECLITEPNQPINIDLCFLSNGQDGEVIGVEIKEQPDGSLFDNGDCTYTYVPLSNMLYMDTLTYCAIDEQGDTSWVATVKINVDGTICPFYAITSNDAEGCAPKAANGYTFTIETDIHDGFGNPLEATDVVNQIWRDCSDGSLIGEIQYAGNDLTTPTGGDADLISNSTFSQAGNIQTLVFDKQGYQGFVHRCAQNICVSYEITAGVEGCTDPITYADSTEIWTTPLAIGHYSGIQITTSDAASNPSSFQHLGLNSWLVDGTGECTRTTLPATGAWGAAEGNGETSNVWYTQESGSAEGVIDAINGSNLVMYDGACPDIANSFGIQFGGVCGSPSYVSGTTGDAYIVVEGTNSDGLQGVSTSYVTMPHTTANQGYLGFKSPANHMLISPNLSTKTNTSFFYYYSIERTGLYASEVVASTSLTITDSGSVDAVTNVIPITASVSGGTVIHNSSPTLNITGTSQLITIPNLPYTIGNRYTAELIVTFQSGKQIRNIQEIECTPFL